MHIPEQGGAGLGQRHLQMVNGRRNIMEPVEAQLMTKVPRESLLCQGPDPGQNIN